MVVKIPLKLYYLFDKFENLFNLMLLGHYLAIVFDLRRVGLFCNILVLLQFKFYLDFKLASQAFSVIVYRKSRVQAPLLLLILDLKERAEFYVDYPNQFVADKNGVTVYDLNLTKVRLQVLIINIREIKRVVPFGEQVFSTYERSIII